MIEMNETNANDYHTYRMVGPYQKGVPHPCTFFCDSDKSYKDIVQQQKWFSFDKFKKLQPMFLTMAD
jgi:hypothetical protein